jgi:hypothetical protein
MIEILPPLGKYKYDTWRVLSVKCYIYSSVRLWSCIQNVNTNLDEGKRNGEGGKISGQMSPFIGEGERERGDRGPTRRRQMGDGLSVHREPVTVPATLHPVGLTCGAIGLKLTWATVPPGRAQFINY